MWFLSDCRWLDSGQEGRGSPCFVVMRVFDVVPVCFLVKKGRTLCFDPVGVFIGVGVECWG